MVTIRALAAADRAEWDPLWQGYLSFYESELADGITERTWQRLLDPLVDLHGLVAVTEEGQIVGFTHYLYHLSSWSENGYCYLEDLFVDPEVRGTGAGRALIEAVARAAAERNADCVYWKTQEFNATARRLYDRVATLTPFIVYER